MKSQYEEIDAMSRFVDSVSAKERLDLFRRDWTKWFAYGAVILFLGWGAWIGFKWYEDGIRKNERMKLAEQASTCSYTYVIDEKGNGKCRDMMPRIDLNYPVEKTNR